MDDEIIQEFNERLSLANMNVSELLGYEPSVGKVLLYLSMVAALDCSDAEDPEAAVETDKDVIANITELAIGRGFDFGKESSLEFEDPKLNDDEWLELFLDAQGFLDDLIEAHTKEFGKDTDEELNLAYNEVGNSIVYMCAVLCARCKDRDKALNYVKENIPSVYRFITEECSLVPRDSVES